MRRITTLFLILLLLNGCAGFGARPTATPPPGATQIVLQSPANGADVASPIILSGTIAPPPNQALIYRLIGPSGSVLAEGNLGLSGDANNRGDFAQAIPYALAAPGPGRIEVFVNGPSGTPLALVTRNLNLSAAAALPVQATPTAAPALAATIVGSDQVITIETPAPQTQVGSPVVLTGRSARMPASGNLIYQVRNPVGSVIGSGNVAVSAQGDGGVFTVSIEFTLPPLGGPISVEIFDQSDAGIAAVAAIPLLVAAAQTISIESPPPGALVESPLVISGRTANPPFQGTLAYRISDAADQELGKGIFPVSENPDGSAQFVSEVSFNAPTQGGRIRLEVYDQNALDNQIIATTVIDLNTAAQPQAISITTPAPGTIVGSPLVITGRLSQLPLGGEVAYVVRGAGGVSLGQGSFAVSELDFTAELSFDLPAQGGPITVELRANDAAPTLPPATASIGLNVNPVGETVIRQVIAIETPAPGTLVGSPVVLTGRVARYPRAGQLNYRIRSADNSQLGAGTFRVNGSATDTDLPWQASLSFRNPERSGELRIEIFEQDPSGAQTATSILPVQFNLPPSPTATPLGPQSLTIETPSDGTVIGDPVVLSGSIARLPRDGNLHYRILSEDGTVIASGFFVINNPPRQGDGFAWQVTLSFPLPPEITTIIIEIADRADDADPSDAEAVDQVELTVNR